MERALQALSDVDLLREPRTIESAQGPLAIIDAREVVLLCSNDYLGLASDPRLADAIRIGAARWGGGAGASRLISGTMAPHRLAERAAAEHVGAAAALIFSSGYAANVGTVQALVGPRDLVLSDALNHASLIDGCRLSRATVKVFRHGDAAHAAALMAEHRGSYARALVVTDAIFSMDGDHAPLPGLREVCDRWDAGLLVDEAHAIGVTGPHGAGLCAELGVRPDVWIGTLGKALGLAGAFVAGSDAIVSLVYNRARSFVFSTAISPAIAAAVPLALAIAREAEDRRARLREHARRLRQGLSDLGLTIGAGSSAIVPVQLGQPATAARFSARLLEEGVLVQAIRPPTVPPGTSRLRVVPTARHETEHIDRALSAFARVVGRP